MSPYIDVSCLLHVHGFPPDLTEVPVDAYESFLRFGNIKEVLAFRTRTTSKNHLFVEFADPDQATAARGKYAGGWQGDPVFARTLMPVYQAIAGEKHGDKHNTYRWDGKSPILPEMLPSSVGGIALPRNSYGSPAGNHGWSRGSDRLSDYGGSYSRRATKSEEHDHAHHTQRRDSRREMAGWERAKRESPEGRWVKNSEASRSSRHRKVEAEEVQALSDDWLFPPAESMRRTKSPTSSWKDAAPLEGRIGSLYSDRISQGDKEPHDASQSRGRSSHRSYSSSSKHKKDKENEGRHHRHEEAYDGQRDSAAYDQKPHSHQHHISYKRPRESDDESSHHHRSKYDSSSVALSSIVSRSMSPPRRSKHPRLSRRMTASDWLEEDTSVDDDLVQGSHSAKTNPDIDGEAKENIQKLIAGNKLSMEEQAYLPSEPRAMRHLDSTGASMARPKPADSHEHSLGASNGTSKRSTKVLNTPPKAALLPKKPSVATSDCDMDLWCPKPDEGWKKTTSVPPSASSSTGSTFFDRVLNPQPAILRSPISLTVSTPTTSSTEASHGRFFRRDTLKTNFTSSSNPATLPEIDSAEAIEPLCLKPEPARDLKGSDVLPKIGGETVQVMSLFVPDEKPPFMQSPLQPQRSECELHMEQISRLRDLYQISQAELSAERAAKRRAEDEMDKERAIRRALEDEVWAMRIKEKSV